MEDAQRNMNTEGMASLEAEEIIREHEVGPPRRIKVVMARGKSTSGWRMTQRRYPSSHTITPCRG